MRSAVDRLGIAVVGILLAMFMVGLALVPLTTPAFTRVLAGQVSMAEEAGIPRADALALAEQVRAFVMSRDADVRLPSTVAGREAFDEAAVAHLSDVRDVIAAARVATGLAAAALTIWLAAMLVRRRTGAIARGLRAGAVACVVTVASALLAGLLDFDALFTRFHGLFFEPGTWVFAADALLIQLFPEAFWMVSGAAWAMLVLAGGGVLWLSARAVDRSSAIAGTGPTASE